MSGRVEVQSRALRSYRVVVMWTEALLTFGMLKLTSLIVTDSYGGPGSLQVMSLCGDDDSDRPIVLICLLESIEETNLT